MADITISPNMNLPVPVVGVDPGPDWANNVNACLNAIDSHNHTAGQGVPITPAAININTDLPMNGNNLTTVRTVRFSAQGSVPSNPADIGCLAEVGVDLYYIDGNGNQIRMTQSGSPTGATGTITGLPSGTASASFALNTFTFQSATNTPAFLNVGPITIGNNTPGSNGITISPPVSLPASYGLFLPQSLPTTTQLLALDSVGNITTLEGANPVGAVPIGAIVATTGSTPGAYFCTENTQGDASGYCQCQGNVLVDSRSPMNGQTMPSLTSNTFLQGNTSSGATGGSVQTIAHTHTMGNHTHIMSHVHQWMAGVDSGGGSGSLQGLNTADPNTGTFVAGGTPTVFLSGTTFQTGGGSNGANFTGANGQWFTTGVLDNFTGSGNNAQTNPPSTNTTSSALTGDNRPPYFDVIFVIRVF